MNVWDQIRQLVGRELRTSDRDKKFEIDAIGNKCLVVVTEDGSPHPIRRAAMEKAVDLHRANPALTRAQLQEALPQSRTTSYMLAICIRLSEAV